MTEHTEQEIGNKEEILFALESKNSLHQFSTKLITYKDGSMDIHCQTGDHHRKSIKKAREILEKRGLTISDKWEFIGPTGAYYSVKKGEEG